MDGYQDYFPNIEDYFCEVDLLYKVIDIGDNG